MLKLRKTSLLILLVGLAVGLGTADARAQGLPQPEAPLLIQATSAYQAGHFSETLNLTKKQLRASDTQVLQRAQSYRLQGLSYVAQGKEKKARKAVQSLILLYPTYNPSDADLPGFNSLVQQAKVSHEQGELSYKSKSSLTNKILLGAAIGMSALTIYLGATSMPQ